MKCEGAEIGEVSSSPREFTMSQILLRINFITSQGAFLLMT